MKFKLTNLKLLSFGFKKFLGIIEFESNFELWSFLEDLRDLINQYLENKELAEEVFKDIAKKYTKP